MAEMKMADIQAKVKAEVFEDIKNHIGEKGEQFADYSIAVPVELNGNEYWAKVVITCGQIKDTASSVAFNPFDVAKDWLEDKETKRKLAETKAKAKADKLARSKSKSKS